MAYSKDDKLKFIEVYKAKNMHIGKACKAFGIHRNTYQEWVKEEWFADEIRSVEYSEIDDAEEMHRWLRQGIIQTETGPDGTVRAVGWAKEPDRAALHFFLERKAKKNGWGLETTISGNNQQGEVVIVRIPHNNRDET